jgi:hypothetical protein
MTTLVKLMADYECFPLWEVLDDGTNNLNPDSLPLTDELKVALRNWAASYDRTLNRDYPPESGFATPEDEAAFEVEGRRLWKELQAQLAPRSRVAYYSSREARLLE